MKRYIILQLIVFQLISCKNQPKNIDVQNTNSYLLSCKNELICYSFMYDDHYYVKLDKVTFWGEGKINKELAYKKISASMDDMIKSIESFDEKKSLENFIYKYAFVNNCNDTVYSNYKLDKWIIKKSGKAHYYDYSKNKNSDTVASRGLRWYESFLR